MKCFIAPVEKCVLQILRDRQQATVLQTRGVFEKHLLFLLQYLEWPQ